ncbi:MAG TPA: ABC transporter permease [Chthoniobacterales bacterium]|nr:ABC transporter permease [Chthoniobacterales bacterium]
MLNDLRYAFRQLIKSPGFAAVAILTLALGIGANTAVFSVVDAVLLRALPHHNSERLIDLFATNPTGDRDGVSIPEFEDLRNQMRSLEDLTAFQSQSVNLTGGERPDRIRGAFVAANFFEVFHLSPVLGRTLAKGEDQPGGPRIAVVNEKLWRERLNSSADLADKKLILNGEPYSVIGVISSEFTNPFDPDVQVWLPMVRYPGIAPRRDSRFLTLVGYLKAESGLAQAQAEANTIASQFAAAYPKENAGRGLKIDFYREFVVGHVRSMLLLLFAAAGAILLIACANLANLLLARGLARQREMSVRAALGASRWRLVRQLLTETTVLGVAGGGAGVLLAHWGLWGLLKLSQNFVTAKETVIDTRVFLFALALAILTGWLFGLVPALQLARTELQTGLKEGGRGSGGGARWNRMRGGFVVAQVAFSILLLIAAGLLIRSFGKLLQADVGFESKNLLTLEYRLPRAKYTQPDAPWNFHQQVLDRVQQIPGVKSAALVRGLPFTGNTGATGIALLDRAAPPAGREPQVLLNLATGSYFSTAQIPLLRGRLFGDENRANAPPVFIINQTMARKFWADQDPIGKQIKVLEEEGVTGTVIGVVGDTKQFGLKDEPTPQLYGAYSQQPIYFATLVVRTTVEPMTLAESVRQAIWRVDADQPMWKIRSFQLLVERSVADRKFVLALMMVFAALALALTVIGLYGVISYLVNQRTQEIGIRMALGAQIHHIMRLILKQGVVLVMLGVVVGLVAAVVLTRLMAHMLYGVTATDPLTFTAVGFLLTLVALLACYLPARRAAQVDPVIALRSE